MRFVSSLLIVSGQGVAGLGIARVFVQHFAIEAIGLFVVPLKKVIIAQQHAVAGLSRVFLYQGEDFALSVSIIIHLQVDAVLFHADAFALPTLRLHTVEHIDKLCIVVAAAVDVEQTVEGLLTAIGEAASHLLVELLRLLSLALLQAEVSQSLNVPILIGLSLYSLLQTGDGLLGLLEVKVVLRQTVVGRSGIGIDRKTMLQQGECHIVMLEELLTYSFKQEVIIALLLLGGELHHGTCRLLGLTFFCLLRFLGRFFLLLRLQGAVSRW